MIGLIIAIIALAQVAFSQTPRFPESVATDRDLLVLRDRAATYLASDISSGTLTVPVVDASRFAANMVVTIDDEQLLVQMVSGNNLIIYPGGRGFGGTVAAPHSRGAPSGPRLQRGTTTPSGWR